jgi:glycosyltransferase involved in cell wall biosynthesis
VAAVELPLLSVGPNSGRTLNIPRVAFGPVAHGWGSWEWIGEDLAAPLGEWFKTETFTADEVPDCDVLVVVKHQVPERLWPHLPPTTRIIYCPVDRYGCAAEIDEDRLWLSRCARIIVHCERLRKYFLPYAPVEYLDHHVKFAISPTQRDPAGPILWTGVRSNVPPLAEWVNAHSLPRPLIILTNPEHASDTLDAGRFGFHARNEVQIESWTADRHLGLLKEAAFSLDIKGNDFRQRHKPAAKAIDCIASGLPLAMNVDSSPVEHLSQMGFDVADPEDTERWFSAEYRRDTEQFGSALRELLSLDRIVGRFRQMIHATLEESGSQLRARRQNRGPADEPRPGRGKEVIRSPRQDSPVAPPAGSLNGSLQAPVVRPPKVRVAILSLLFNWPSTGGGTVHTAETGKFLQRAGYEVRHIYAQYADWGLGIVTQPLETPTEPLPFDAKSWHAAEIQRRFRRAVDDFAPDYVIITDSWNSKPLLAEAVQDYRYFLRLAAQECLCPLNNVRLLVDEQGRISACPKQQLATPDDCRECVRQRQQQSGGLHQAERGLVGYGTPEYDAQLRRAFAQAEGVLAVNPLIAAMVSPYCKAVHVIPSGFDPERFPWPPDDIQRPADSRAVIFFAGLVDEYMKGFRVLHSAAARLWAKRQDFEIVATGDPPGQVDAMTRFVGWLSQEELPRHLRQADFLVFPTIAEEALGRTAVEAMGVGRPVIASRIGGLPFTVTEGLTGLLFEPGNVEELAAKMEMLLDDRQLRERMGKAARQRFVEHFTWDVIIDKSYRPLLKPLPRVRPSASGSADSSARSD